MYETNNYQKISLNRYSYKNFGTGFSNPGFGSWYPSYLGVDIFFTNLEENLLGMTNGKRILVKEGMPKELRDFVLMHEEEHVKDMSATELEIDERALKRFFAKHNKITEEVQELLGKRWELIAKKMMEDLYG